VVRALMPTIATFIPGLVPKTTLNSRDHWAVKAHRAKQERSAAFLILRTKGKPPELPVTVELTRHAARLMDSDQIVTVMKSVRDGVADWLGVDDGDDRITWVVKQRKAPKHPGTMILVAGEAK
jgi:hypothetical protein